jgi:hypothetical protein
VVLFISKLKRNIFILGARLCVSLFSILLGIKLLNFRQKVNILKTRLSVKLLVNAGARMRQ